MNCGPRFLQYRIYLKNQMNPILTIGEVIVVKVLYPQGCQLTVRIGKIIQGFQPLVGMYFAESQIIQKSTLAECEDRDGLMQTNGLQMLAFGEYINQTCFGSDFNSESIPYLIGDRNVYCLGDQTTKYNTSLKYPEHIENEISSARKMVVVNKTDEFDYCMNLFNSKTPIISSIELNIIYKKLLSCDSDFVEVPQFVNYTALSVIHSQPFTIVVEIIYQDRLNMFGLNVLLFIGRILANKDMNNQYFVSVSIFSPTERSRCLVEPFFDSIEGSTKLLITDLLSIKQYIRRIRLIRNMDDMFANFPDTTLCCGSATYHFNPGLREGSLICPTC